MRWWGSHFPCGIALASGAAPITGVISAIIAGIVFPLLGGAYITISGPAAGLAPALLAGMLTLGQGDLEAGYPLVLVAICLTGAVQVLLSVYKAGRFAMYFPISVLQGMLAAIGMLIIINQIPAFLGHLTPTIKSIPDAIILIPAQIMGMNLEVFAVGGATLAILFGLDSNIVKHQRWMRNIPAPLLAVALGGVAGWMLHFPEAYLIHVPKDVLAQGIHFPNFSEIWQRSELWFALLTIVVTLTLIDGTETLATIAAIDKIDPFDRKSDPNVTLRTMGVSNILSGLVGGLTIIPGGVKSTANIIAGGRTLMGEFLLCPIPGALRMVRDRPDKQNPAHCPGRLAHIYRMEIVCAENLPEGIFNRDRAAPGRGRLRRGNPVHFRYLIGSDRRNCDEDPRALF